MRVIRHSSGKRRTRHRAEAAATGVSEREVRDQIVSGDVLAAQCGTRQRSRPWTHRQQSDSYIPPRVTRLYPDCMVILRESKRQEIAHQFVNFSCVRMSRQRMPWRRELPRRMRERASCFQRRFAIIRRCIGTRHRGARRVGGDIGSGDTAATRSLWTEIKAS